LIFLGSIYVCNETISGSGIPNPAAVYYVEMGYKYQIRGNVGFVIFPDSSECEERAI